MKRKFFESGSVGYLIITVADVNVHRGVHCFAVLVCDMTKNAKRGRLVQFRRLKLLYLGDPVSVKK